MGPERSGVKLDIAEQRKRFGLMRGTLAEMFLVAVDFALPEHFAAEERELRQRALQMGLECPKEEEWIYLYACVGERALVRNLDTMRKWVEHHTDKSVPTRAMFVIG